jgi:hypothetical protein
MSRQKKGCRNSPQPLETERTVGRGPTVLAISYASELDLGTPLPASLPPAPVSDLLGKTINHSIWSFESLLLRTRLLLQITPVRCQDLFLGASVRMRFIPEPSSSVDRFEEGTYSFYTLVTTEPVTFANYRLTFRQKTERPSGPWLVV